ncbi:hypothetical protein CK203_064179 [Vitis vinifera]|uniref:Uncharacterized protein n=1 Tax=Vitis vinifera TaxID=29760 RepID=A0A438FR71_VITVI|nr:hypothetical protein CK203_064179 [Vitis vinifera]
MDPEEEEMPKVKHRVELSSYLGTITRTHVPIIIESWRKVPKETKEKLWDLIMTSFNVNQNSKRNCFLLMGIRFRTFKYKLTKKYILSCGPSLDPPDRRDLLFKRKERNEKVGVFQS